MKVAGYCRTSSESQRNNESIPIQKHEIERYSNSRSWTIKDWYIDESRSGSSTKGRDEFQRMLKDAANAKFDAIVVYDIKRFSRDGVDILESAKSLKTLYGILTIDTKGNFDNSSHKNTLANYVFAGAAESERIEILERTKPAKIRAATEYNAPVNGKIPWGRIWDKKAKKWSVDQTKKEMIEEIAERYLQGEKIPNLAVEFGLKKCQLYKILRERSGGIWVQNVRCSELGINERIETRIPPLLNETVIRAIKKKADENRTWDKDRSSKRIDMLGGFIFCAGCGHSLTAESSRGTVRYRHKKNEACPFHPCPSVRQDMIDTAVMDEIIQLLEDPKRLYKRLFAENMPIDQRLDELNESISRLEKQLSEIEKKRNQVLDLDLGKLSQQAIESKLQKLEESEADIRQKLETLTSEKEAKLSEDKIRKASHKFISAAKRRIQMREAVHPPKITIENARTILKDTCGGKLPGGKRMGIYITPIDQNYGAKFKRFRFEIKGCIEAWGVTNEVPEYASC